MQVWLLALTLEGLLNIVLGLKYALVVEILNHNGGAIEVTLNFIREDARCGFEQLHCRSKICSN